MRGGHPGVGGWGCGGGGPEVDVGVEDLGGHFLWGVGSWGSVGRWVGGWEFEGGMRWDWELSWGCGRFFFRWMG